jgi:hypothetical protein
LLIDFRSDAPKDRAYCARLLARFHGTLKCLLNGVEIKCPYYINTNVRPHVVKDYNVLGDGKLQIYVGQALPYGAEILDNGVLSRTVRGKVTFLVPNKYL